MKKRYENFMIEKSTRQDKWWLIFKDGNFFATTPTEESKKKRKLKLNGSIAK